MLMTRMQGVSCNQHVFWVFLPRPNLVCDANMTLLENVFFYTAGDIQIWEDLGVKKLASESALSS